MSTDLFLVIGLVLAVLSIPSALAAMIDGRSPRAAAVIFLIGSGLVGFAVHTAPGGYSIAEIPDVIIRVIAPLF